MARCERPPCESCPFRAEEQETWKAWIALASRPDPGPVVLKQRRTDYEAARAKRIRECGDMAHEKKGLRPLRRRPGA